MRFSSKLQRSIGVLYGLALCIGITHSKITYEATSDTASIAWTRSQGAKLVLTRLDKGRALPITEDGRNGEHIFHGLTSGAAYRLDVTPHGGERETIKFNTKPNKLTTIRSSKFFRQNPDNTEGGAADAIYGAVLYWTPPEGNLDGYVLDIEPKHGEIKAPVLQKNGELVQDNTQPRRVVTGLEPGREYNFTVSSTSGRELSTPTTLSTRIPPETPGSISVADIGSRTAVLEWQREHRGFLDGFYLETNPPDETAITKPRTDTDKQREITGLKPGKKYAVKVHSTAYGLLSFRPSERSIITLPEAPLGDLIVISQDPVNVTLTWTPPDGEAQMYHIIYYPTKSDARKLKELSINNTITLTNMEPGTEYNFEIETVSNGLHSDPQVTTVSTEPDRVSDLEVLSTDFTSASIGWKHPQAGNSALFKVEYSPSSQDSWPDSPFVTQDQVAAVDGLMPGKTYTFTVTTVINSVESKPERVKATLPIPEKPSNVSIDNVSNNDFEITWESPYDDALYVVNVFGPDGNLDEFPQTTHDKTVTVDGLDDGETYHVTVATVVDGYTTDKHAMKVETYADTQTTMLFGLGDNDLEAAKEDLSNFSNHLGQVQPDNAIDISVGDVESINDADFAVVSVSISAKPSELSAENLNALYNNWKPHDDPFEEVTEAFSAPINTNLNECKMRNNACSANAVCTDLPILYRCDCKPGYVDVTQSVVDGSDLVNLAGQVCVANPEDHCVRTNWKFQRNGYLVVRRRMPAVSEFTLCFTLLLNSQRLRGTITTYRMGDTILLMHTDDRGNLKVVVNDEQLFAPNDIFMPDITGNSAEQKVCLTASDDLINLYVDGVSIDTRNPSGSVGLEAGGKIQIGKDPECNKRCERERGALAAIIEDYTIWNRALSSEEVEGFAGNMCITNGIMSLEQEVIDPNGPIKPVQESLDELFGLEMIPDEIIRRFTTMSPPRPRVEGTPTTDYSPFNWGLHFNHQPTQRTPELESFVVDLNNQGTTVDKLIGDTDDLETFCKPDNMTILVQRAFIDEYEAKYGVLTLEDPSCTRLIRGDYYAWEIAPDLLGCGSTIELTDTHVTFVNSLSTSSTESNKIAAVGGIIFGNQLTEEQTTKVSMSVACEFPLDYTVTADYPFLPQITMQLLKFNVSGHGEFSAVMQLYEDDTFSRAYESSPEISEGEMLNVGVSLLETEDPTIRVTILECWATPQQDPNVDLQHFLIEEGCGVDGVLDGTLQIFENGQSKMAKWAGSVFKFVGYDQVWLHCNIRVCFGEEDCKPGCEKGRKRRDTDEFELHTVSTSHPIRRVELAIELDEVSIETSNSSGESLITGLIAGVTALTLLLLNAIGLIILRRRRTKSIDQMSISN